MKVVKGAEHGTLGNFVWFVQGEDLNKGLAFRLIAPDAAKAERLLALLEKENVLDVDDFMRSEKVRYAMIFNNGDILLNGKSWW